MWLTVEKERLQKVLENQCVGISWKTDALGVQTTCTWTLQMDGLRFQAVRRWVSSAEAMADRILHEAALRRLALPEERVDWMHAHGGSVDLRPLVQQSGKRKLGR